MIDNIKVKYRTVIFNISSFISRHFIYKYLLNRVITVVNFSFI